MSDTPKNPDFAALNDELLRLREFAREIIDAVDRLQLVHVADRKGPRRAGEFTRLRPSEAAKRVLQRNGGKMKVGEVIQAVIAGGFGSDAPPNKKKNLEGDVKSAITRHSNKSPARGPKIFHIDDKGQPGLVRGREHDVWEVWLA